MAAVADIEFAGAELAAIGASAGYREFDFLLACCRRENEAINTALCGAGALAREESTWFTLQSERALALADHHRVLPAVYAALRHRSDVPVMSHDKLRTRFQKHVQQTLRFSAEISGILRKFRQRGIEVLPYKGAVLARTVFGDAAMRQFGDLDFLVRAADVPRARAALQELGYYPNLRLSPRQEREYLRVGNEYVFGCDRGKNLVELQWQILPRFYSAAFDMDALFSRSIETGFEGQPVRVLSKEDLMLVLCAHAAKHEWEHLGMVRDIAKLAGFDLDWQWIGTEAKQLGIFRILAISLLLARNLLESELPNWSLVDKEAERLAAAAELKLRAGKYCDPESLRYFRHMIALRERHSDRARFAWRLAATSNVGEWKSVAIPDQLFFLYRGVRAARLARRLFV